MNSRTTRRFQELFGALPAHVARQAREAYRLFRENPGHPGLHFKQVHPDPPTYYARVGISYRAVGVVEGDTVIWFWIGTHASTGMGTPSFVPWSTSSNASKSRRRPKMRILPAARLDTW